VSSEAAVSFPPLPASSHVRFGGCVLFFFFCVLFWVLGVFFFFVFLLGFFLAWFFFFFFWCFFPVTLVSTTAYSSSIFSPFFLCRSAPLSAPEARPPSAGFGRCASFVFSFSPNMTLLLFELAAVVCPSLLYPFVHPPLDMRQVFLKSDRAGIFPFFPLSEGLLRLSIVFDDVVASRRP